MIVKELTEKGLFELLNEGDHMEEPIEQVYCCDLLSVAMGSLPAGSAWVTVMANINTLAVASLTDAACVILAHHTEAEGAFLSKANATGITVLRSDEPVFETALSVHKLLQQ